MRPLLEELAREETPAGVLSLRRRHDPWHRRDVYEIKLDDEFLMSSLFTVSERELARRGLARVDGDDLEVVVGGLGLGFTAVEALADPRVRSLTVVESVSALIDWHRQGLVPESAALAADPRVRLVQGDFFALAAGDTGFAPDASERRVDAVLLDIDHSPRKVLHPSHAAFYTATGLRRLARWIRPGGAFALWSDDTPDDDVLAVLREVFVAPHAEVVTFPNPVTGGESTSTVYLATAAD